MDRIDDLQNEIEHLHAVCARQEDELVKVYVCFSNHLVGVAVEISQLRAIIEQMLDETGHGGNKRCGDNKLTAHTVELARALLGNVRELTVEEIAAIFPRR
jgi:hypothetical protein